MEYRIAMTAFKVIVPDELHQVLEFIQEDAPGVAVINASLKTFQPQEVFGWHLSIMIDLKDVVENGMPSESEQKSFKIFEAFLGENIRGRDAERPNALFLARTTWNHTRELVWRVYEPEVCNWFLENLIADDSVPQSFDYKMEYDKEWKLAEWYLNQ